MLLRFIGMMIFQLALIWLTGYFLSAQANPMLWPVYGKIITLILIIISIRSALKED
jgi:hypothetical protein